MTTPNQVAADKLDIAGNLMKKSYAAPTTSEGCSHMAEAILVIIGYLREQAGKGGEGSTFARRKPSDEHSSLLEQFQEAEQKYPEIYKANPMTAVMTAAHDQRCEENEDLRQQLADRDATIATLTASVAMGKRLAEEVIHDDTVIATIELAKNFLSSLTAPQTAQPVAESKGVCPTCGGAKRIFPLDIDGTALGDEPCPTCCQPPTPEQAKAGETFRVKRAWKWGGSPSIPQRFEVWLDGSHTLFCDSNSTVWQYGRLVAQMDKMHNATELYGPELLAVQRRFEAENPLSPIKEQKP